jgi:hypothetical protein
MPRNLLCELRSNLPAPLITDKKNYWETIADAPNPVTQLGALSYGKGFAPTPMAAAAPFEKFIPDIVAPPAEVAIWSPETKTNFTFSTMPIPDWQVHFVWQLGKLFRDHDVRPVMLHLPALAEARTPVLAERTDWTKIFGGDFKLMGIPPAKMFGGLTDNEVHKLYGDPFHFNRNGQEYFTRLIMPTLVQIYEASR